jgi:hypothetical protein
MSSSDQARYQLRLKGAAQELLAAMCKDLNATPKDVILDALAVMHFATQAVREGQQVGSYDPKSQKFAAIVTPSLQHLAEKRSAREMHASR